ncbi:MAG: MATE family efflux transporter [Elusimicrobiota bacterium]
MLFLSPTKRSLLKIALPAVSGFLGMMVYHMVDIFWIAKLGTETVAGVAASQYWSWTIEAIMGLTTIGCATLISQSIGAGRPAGARAAAREAVQLSFVLSLGIMAVFYPAMPALLRWVGLTPAAHSEGLTYIRLLILGLPLMHMALLGNQIFNAHGDTKTAFTIMTAALVVNATLDPILMFGWLGAPAMGVAGAAWASIIGWAIGVALRIFFLRRRGFIPPFADFARPSFDYFKRILHVGAPTAASHLIGTTIYPLLTTLITGFGMAALAGMTIAHRFESVAYFTCMGFSIATATMVGQAVGRGDAKGACAIAYEARTLITAILIPMSCVFVFMPEALLSLITDDPAAVAHGASYLRKVGYFEVFLGWEFVFEGGFNGLGSTRRYMYISVPLTLIRYPAAWLLVFVYNRADVIWWCITVSTLLKGLAMAWSFRRSRAADLGITAAV